MEYKNCKDVSMNECKVGGKNCGTCMYRDNERYKDGFRKDAEISGKPDWCTACPK